MILINIQGYEIPDNLYGEEHHYWGRIEDGLVVAGAADYTQKNAGEFVFVELPYKGDQAETLLHEKGEVIEWMKKEIDLHNREEDNFLYGTYFHCTRAHCLSRNCCGHHSQFSTATQKNINPFSVSGFNY